jgi:UDP-N-acetylmuramoyl-tripeptide--D-alanyl-D-alanine ligase
MSNWVCTVQELAQATGGQILSQVAAPFVRVSTDSRADLTGKLFIPLKGENFDGHDYVAQAVEKGATAVMVGKWKAEWQPLLNQASFVQVPDTLQGLQSFGRFWRRKHKFKVIAVTGSNGKTSTKEFTYALLKDKFKTHASKGSYNNHWGVPLSILEAGSDITHLILEMGMNHGGELFRLCMIGEPDIVTVTTVGRAHIGELGSQENVAKAKEEIYVACSNAVQIFNVDNEWTMRMHARAHGKKMTFSAFKPGVDVHFRAQRISWEGLDILGHIKHVEGNCWVQVMGRQNVVNLMAAASLALAAGMEPAEIWKALGKIDDVAWGRNQIVLLNNGARVLFDAYNANPDSMQALLKNVYEMDVPGRKFLIAGDMKELGTFTEAAHQEMGEKAAACGFEGIWYVGANGLAFAKGLDKVAKPKTFHISADVDQKFAAEFLKLIQDGDLVAVKASRGMALERVLANWPLKTPLGVKP